MNYIYGNLLSILLVGSGIAILIKATLIGGHPYGMLGAAIGVLGIIVFLFTKHSP